MALHHGIRVSTVVLLAALVLGGCALLSMRAPYTVPAGSTLTLERPIKLPPGPFSVWLQDGRYGLQAVDDYRAFCELHGETHSSTGVWLQPTRFEVVDVHYRYGHAGLPVRIPLAGLVPFGMGNAELTKLRTEMILRAGESTPVDSMVCMQRGFVGRDEFVSVDAIRAALGDYFTLTLPPR